MPKKKRQFIDKKTAAHFSLVHTSRDDEEDEKLGKHPLVLQPFLSLAQQRKGQYEVSEKILNVAGAERDEFGHELYYSEDEDQEESEEEEMGIPIVGLAGASSRNPARLTKPILTKPEEIEKVDCYFPQDGYDYDSHLKRINPDMFVPVHEEDMPADAKVPEPRTKEEAEIMEVMDNASDYDEADDHFFSALMGKEANNVVDEEALKFGPGLAQSSGCFAVPEGAIDINTYLAGRGQFNEFDQFEGSDEEEVGSQLCPVGGRANHELDARFEELLAEYTDDEIGELDEDTCALEAEQGLIERSDELHESVNAFLKIHDDRLEDIFQDHAREQIMNGQKGREDQIDVAGIKHHLGLDNDDDNEEESDDSDYDIVEKPKEDEWDVESVLSTKTNTTNHPGKVNRLTVAGPKKSHKKKGAILAPIDEEDEVILPEIVAVRDKNETPEEKKARKAAVKEAQRICREMKKQNKNVWKEETKKFKDRQAATNGGLRLGIRAIPI